MLLCVLCFQLLACTQHLQLQAASLHAAVCFLLLACRLADAEGAVASSMVEVLLDAMCSSSSSSSNADAGSDASSSAPVATAAGGGSSSSQLMWFGSFLYGVFLQEAALASAARRTAAGISSGAHAHACM